MVTAYVKVSRNVDQHIIISFFIIVSILRKGAELFHVKSNSFRGQALGLDVLSLPRSAIYSLKVGKLYSLCALVSELKTTG